MGDGIKWAEKVLFKKDEDLLWFYNLIQLKTIESNFYFQKYLVAGISDETLALEVAKVDFKQSLLKPSILFR